MLADLESAAVQHLATCRAVLGTDSAIADILDVSPSQITRWRRGQTPDTDNADRLAGLALVLEMAARWLPAEGVPSWMQGANAHLAGHTPAHRIRLGHVADVIGALEAEKAGVYS